MTAPAVDVGPANRSALGDLTPGQTITLHAGANGGLTADAASFLIQGNLKIEPAAHGLHDRVGD